MIFGYTHLSRLQGESIEERVNVALLFVTNVIKLFRNSPAKKKNSFFYHLIWKVQFWFEKFTFSWIDDFYCLKLFFLQVFFIIVEFFVFIWYWMARTFEVWTGSISGSLRNIWMFRANVQHTLKLWLARHTKNKTLYRLKLRLLMFGLSMNCISGLILLNLCSFGEGICTKFKREKESEKNPKNIIKKERQENLRKMNMNRDEIFSFAAAHQHKHVRHTGPSKVKERY